MTDPYENSLDLHSLRREARKAWDSHGAFIEAVRTVPDMANPEALWHIAEAAMNIKHVDVWSIGKAAQREMGLEAVPPKSELEAAAGLWIIVRDALRAAKEG